MSILNSHLQVEGHAFLTNRSLSLDRWQEIQSIVKRQRELELKAKPHFQKQGKLLPRERIAQALDPGSPFFEICALAGYLQFDDTDGSLSGGGIVGGIGVIGGICCLLVANNSAVKGGTINPVGLDKILRLQQIAQENRLPLVTFAESGGANLNFAPQVYIPGARAFANQARLSAFGVPQFTIVHGNATAGGAYQPGLSDYTIMIRNQSQMFLAGPPLVEAAIGEKTDAEELGGAQIHAHETGSCDYLVDSDEEAIAQLRRLVKQLNWRPFKFINNKIEIQPPLFSASELLGIVPANEKEPYDVREILARILDGSKFEEFKRELDSQTVCGHGEILGHKVGLIGNNGPITSAGAGKGAQFIELCSQAGLPLIFVHNTTGFMVGSQAEHSGIIRQGAKMIQAVANSQVTKISLVVGGSFGAGNYAMCGRGFDPHFVLAWPSARTAVMGGEQAGKVMRLIAEAKARQKGENSDSKRLSEIEKQTAETLNATSTALYSTSHLWDDGIIDPRDTRDWLGLLLHVRALGYAQVLRAQAFGVSRH